MFEISTGVTVLTMTLLAAPVCAEQLQDRETGASSEQSRQQGMPALDF